MQARTPLKKLLTCHSINAAFSPRRIRGAERKEEQREESKAKQSTSPPHFSSRIGNASFFSTSSPTPKPLPTLTFLFFFSSPSSIALASAVLPALPTASPSSASSSSSICSRIYPSSNFIE
ncbi:hypothetical protein EYC84_001625 [Monilinia fructicola]|uniref:Uncharacterized protein n=1 Tax=Monilinia fructicola TaxID=38448 RepID=A0A5M9JSN6_MONFR|nr:hypothetical protein EYC84_001625 [Monilinia fructicola]